MTSASTYLSFNGNAREAMAYYQEVFGGELTVSTYSEFGMNERPEDGDLVMHSQLTGPGFDLMGSDATAQYPAKPFGGFAVALWGEPADDATLRGWWAALADGGTIAMPLENAPWGDAFGQLDDKYGVTWMINIGTVAT
ncbi:VOC family protein [Agromyces seonyuensis]|uniref:VOC family protein n=1 Tax=Agromyces seonyuensis TaxID=2662446 RepID=A0A6I4P4Y4_9MICO|nr:VOC family protein [Agromyces seonyuensis]MWB98537.1 VOC family protein [Agromyces seonyuensis]